MATLTEQLSICSQGLSDGHTYNETAAALQASVTQLASVQNTMLIKYPATRAAQVMRQLRICLWM